MLIATSLSLIVTAGMIALLSMSLTNTARIIKMTRLTDDLRMVMQMMSRDVRRSNYTADAINCFANPDCNTVSADWTAVTDPNDIDVTEFSVDDALSYTEVVLDDGEENQFFQKVRKLRMSINGRLTWDASIQRSIEDVVKLRNNLYL